MTTNPFGGWDTMPENGCNDVLANLWHWLAAQHVGTPNQQNNSMMAQRRGEITMLWSLYQRVKPRTVLEIGVSQAATLASWCFLGDPSAKILALDKDLNDALPRGGEQINPRIVSRQVNSMSQDGGGIYALSRNNQRMIGVTGWSFNPETVEQVKIALAGEKLQWIWNDGSHSADMARKDFDLYWPLVASGGVYASHDVMPSKVPECNKSEWWEETRDRDDYSMRMEFFSSRNEDSMGIGVLVKA